MSTPPRMTTRRRRSATRRSPPCCWRAAVDKIGARAGHARVAWYVGRGRGVMHGPTGMCPECVAAVHVAAFADGAPAWSGALWAGGGSVPPARRGAAVPRHARARQTRIRMPEDPNPPHLLRRSGPGARPRTRGRRRDDVKTTNGVAGDTNRYRPPLRAPRVSPSDAVARRARAAPSPAGLFFRSFASAGAQFSA